MKNHLRMLLNTSFKGAIEAMLLTIRKAEDTVVGFCSLAVLSHVPDVVRFEKHYPGQTPSEVGSEMLAGGKTQVAYVPRPSQPKEDHYDLTIYGDSSVVHGTTLGEVNSEDDSEAEAVMEAKTNKQSGIVIDGTQFSVSTVLRDTNATALQPMSDAFGLPCFLLEEASTKAMDLVTAALLGVEEAAGDDAANEEDLGDDDDDDDDKQNSFAAALSGLSTKPKAATKKAPQASRKPPAPTPITRGASSASLNSTGKESHAGASSSAAPRSLGVFPFVAASSAEDVEKRGRGSCSCRVDPVARAVM
eukprot:6491210-Amphidinium_carterae.2